MDDVHNHALPWNTHLAVVAADSCSQAKFEVMVRRSRCWNKCSALPLQCLRAECIHIWKGHSSCVCTAATASAPTKRFDTVVAKHKPVTLPSLPSNWYCLFLSVKRFPSPRGSAMRSHYLEKLWRHHVIRNPGPRPWLCEYPFTHNFSRWGSTCMLTCRALHFSPPFAFWFST